MAWLCVGFSGKEMICQRKPARYEDKYWMMNPINNNSVDLPKGTIKKLIGKDLSWEDEPVEFREE